MRIPALALVAALSLAGVRAASAAPCVPRAWERTKISLSAAGNVLSVCATSDASSLAEAATQCWSADPPKAATLTPLIAPLFRGHSVRGDACQLGYCRAPRPALALDHAGERIALSDDGAWVGVLSLDTTTPSDTVDLYDAKTKKLIRTIELRPATSNDETEWFEGAGDLRIAGQTLFVEGFVSGASFTGIWQYKLTGERSGQLFHDPAHTWDLNVAELVQTDATHVVARDRGYQQVTVDVTTGQRTRVVLPRPAACTQGQLEAQMWIDNAGEPGPGALHKVSARCRAAIRKAQSKLWLTLGVELGGVRYHVEASKRRWSIRPFGSRAFQHVIDLPRCKD